MTLKNSASITVITVVYNDVANLDRTIKSVLEQTYPHVEYIIIDGGSTDGSVEVIRQYESKLAGWVSEKDKGIYDAMNKGLRMATGQWVNFMNSGDVFANNGVLEVLFGEAAAFYPNTVVVYGDVEADYGGFHRLVKASTTSKSTWRKLPFCHQSTFTALPAIQERGFDTNYRLAADFDFFYEQLKVNQGLSYYKPVPVAVISVNGVSDMQRLKVVREYENVVSKHRNGVSHRVYYYFYGLNLKIRLVIKRLLGKNMTNFIIRRSS